MSKKLFSTFLVAFIVLVLSFSLIACTPTNDESSNDDNTNQNQQQTNTNPPTTPQVEEACSFVSLDINPEISLTIDENELVVSVYGENEDGQVLLYEESANIVGKDIESAIDKIVSLAIEYGYLDEENKVVGTTVSSADDVMDLIKEDLSDEELKEIEDAKASILAGLQSQKDAFESALNSAAQTAKSRIEAIRNERKQAE